VEVPLGPLSSEAASEPRDDSEREVSEREDSDECSRLEDSDECSRLEDSDECSRLEDSDECSRREDSEPLDDSTLCPDSEVDTLAAMELAREAMLSELRDLVALDSLRAEAMEAAIEAL